ncbi:HesA/MoeB/ThiF family protein (plasmid) [Methylomonas sp. MS20]|uniref:HesA/MoeB/ThiF family protein n=1 Tax=Methylomonas sp. MS20 TaxID=3418769 RepID=UPI003D000DA7
MTEIVVGVPTITALINSLQADTERGAALYLCYDAVSNRYLVHDIEIANEADVLSASEIEITFAPQFLTRITRRAREQKQHLVLLHTHPKGAPEFSLIDDATEVGLVEFVKKRIPDGNAFSMILCDGKLKARWFGTQESISVRQIGPIITIPATRNSEDENNERYDRQVRAFGEHGQRILRNLSVVIVGLGGTGSVTVQQLAHLGVGTFILIDPDAVEETNLNRVVGTQPESVGKSKIDVASILIRTINPSAQVHIYSDSVITENARRLMCSADCIFMCTDSHVSRAFLSEFAFQYLIPAFDIGVSITLRDNHVYAVTGRTQMLAPGLPCLLCSNVLDSRIIREELMTPEQRESDPYFNGGSGVNQPAVISLNSTMVSLAVTMFLAAFTGTPVRARWQSYDALTGNVRVFATKPDPDCPICGANGVIAAGDSRHLSFLE